MAEPRLQDDLLQAFREERTLIDSQITLIEPLSQSLSKPAILRWAGRGAGFMLEILCWLLCLACVAGCFFLKNIFPFYVLFELNRTQYLESLGRQPIQMLQWSVYALIIVIGILFAIIARTIATVHRRNDLLHQAAIRLQKVLDQNKKRKATLEELDRKHFGAADNVSQTAAPSSPQ